MSASEPWKGTIENQRKYLQDLLKKRNLSKEE